MPSELDFAYAAGLIDGDGCISFRKRKSETCRTGFTFGSSIVVRMTSPIVPTWFHITFGGGLYKRPQQGLGDKPVYDWQLWSGQAARLLEVMLPYLKEKRKLAEIAVELHKLQTSRRYSMKHPKSPIQLETEKGLFEAAKAISWGNRRKNEVIVQ